jgi:arsenite oxidase small subunit
MVDVGRRKFLSGAGMTAAGAAAATVLPPPAKSAGAGRVQYPSNRLANVRDLKPNEPLDVSYLDADAPGVLLKLGNKVPGGGAPRATSSAFPPPARTRGSPQLHRRR